MRGLFGYVVLCTSLARLLHARCASRAQLLTARRGAGARRGGRRPLGGPARSEVEVEVVLVSEVETAP